MGVRHLAAGHDAARRLDAVDGWRDPDTGPQFRTGAQCVLSHGDRSEIDARAPGATARRQRVALCAARVCGAIRAAGDAAADAIPAAGNDGVLMSVGSVLERWFGRSPTEVSLED